MGVAYMRQGAKRRRLVHLHGSERLDRRCARRPSRRAAVPGVSAGPSSRHSSAEDGTHRGAAAARPLKQGLWASRPVPWALPLRRGQYWHVGVLTPCSAWLQGRRRQPHDNDDRYERVGRILWTLVLVAAEGSEACGGPREPSRRERSPGLGFLRRSGGDTCGLVPSWASVMRTS